MVSNIVAIVLRIIGLGKVLSRHALYSQFLAYAIWFHKNATPKKLAYVG